MAAKGVAKFKASIVGASCSEEGRGPAPQFDLTDEEVSAAFEFFDVRGRGTIMPADLRERLAIFYPDLPPKEYKLLISEPNFNKQARARQRGAENRPPGHRRRPGR